ncbi:hypothetical protein Lser_V15G44176 [Lactuca serriola]
MGTKGCMFGDSDIEMGFRVGGLLQFPIKVKEESVLLDTLRSLSTKALAPVTISVLNSDPLNGMFEKIHKDFSQAWETEDFYYPLAAKAATISLLSFRGSNFGFDALCKKLHKQNSYQNGDYRIKPRNCRMTRSYRNVQPIVAKASNNDQYNCVPTIMTTIATTVIAASLKNQPILREILMRVAMSKASDIEYECVSKIITLIAQNLMSQPKFQEILLIGAITMAINFPLGMCREHGKFSPPWLTVLLVAFPYISFLAKVVLMPKTTMAYVLGLTILGQVLGSMAEQHRLKSIAAMYPPWPYHKVYYHYY